MKSLRSPQHQRLSESLVDLRKRAGMTQVQLATCLGVPQSYVAKVEGMERRIDVVEFVNWLAALDQDEAGETVLKALRELSPISGSAAS